MLILATHYEIQAPKEGEDGGIQIRKGMLRFQEMVRRTKLRYTWGIKSDFFTKLGAFEVSPSFKDFRDWLLELQTSLACGMQARAQHSLQQRIRVRIQKKTRDAVNSVVFDDETLGGHVTYSALIQPARHLTGALEGLAIRYDPPSPLPPSSTGVAQANA
jgi:hypothetical protein